MTPERVSPAGKGLDKARIIGGVVQRFPKFLDSFVDPAIKIDGFGGPKLSLELLPCHQLTRPLEQCCQNLERLFLKVDVPAVFPDFAGLQINLEEAKTHHSGLT